MKTLWLRLPSIHAVKDFVSRCNSFAADFEVASGEHTASGKSLLGMLTLNLSEPLELHIRAEAEDLPLILKGIEPYCI